MVTWVDIMKRQKKDLKRIEDFLKGLDTRFTRNTLVGALIILLFFSFWKKVFFMAAYAVLIHFVLSLKLKFGIDFPIQAVSLGTFMCGYVYGPAEGMTIAAGSLVSLAILGRFSAHTFFNTLIIIFVGYAAHLFRFMPLPEAGIALISFRYVFDLVFNLVVFKQTEIFQKIPKRVINLLFYIFFYYTFGDALAMLMQ